MSRRGNRSLIAVPIALAVIVLSPVSLAAESSAAKPGASSTTTATSAPLPKVSTPNPFGLYPRRPGAKYWDVEAPFGAEVRLPLFGFGSGLVFGDEPGGAAEPSIALALTGARVVARAAVAPDLVATDRSRYAGAGLVEGFSPLLPDGDRVLQLDLRTDRPEISVACAATSAVDGAVALPLDVPGRFDRTLTSRGRNRAVQELTDALEPPRAPGDMQVNLAIGASAGRFYVACVPIGLGPFGGRSRAVWSVDA